MSEGSGKYPKAQENIRRPREISEGSGIYQKVQGNIRRFREISELSLEQTS